MDTNSCIIRGGTVVCELRGDRVKLAGTCAPFAQGIIRVS